MATDISPLPRSPDTDEVLRRVGRNVVNFQYIEHLLKRLTVVSVPAGPVSKMAARVEKQVASVNTSTMGILAGKLKDTVLTSPPERAAPDDIDEIWIGIRFSMEVEAEFVDRHDQEMQALVDARNDLSSTASCRDGTQQYRAAQPVLWSIWTPRMLKRCA